MPQLSLYLDEDIHREQETRARLSKTSISRFDISTLKTHFSNSWPDGYRSIYGSVTDESFVKQEVSDWTLDAPRENLYEQ